MLMQEFRAVRCLAPHVGTSRGDAAALLSRRMVGGLARQHPCTHVFGKDTKLYSPGAVIAARPRLAASACTALEVSQGQIFSQSPTDREGRAQGLVSADYICVVRRSRS